MQKKFKTEQEGFRVMIFGDEYIHRSKSEEYLFPKIDIFGIEINANTAEI